MKYYRPEYGESADDAVAFPTPVLGWPSVAEAAEAAADHYHAHGGWESTWPIRLAVLDDLGSLFGVCDVTRETVPEFSATIVPDEPPEESEVDDDVRK